TRSRNVEVINPRIIGSRSADTDSFGIQTTGSSVGTTIRGGYIEGYYRGVAIFRTELAQQGPVNRDVHVVGTRFRGCARDVEVVTGGTGQETTDYCGVSVINTRHRETIDYGVLIGNYANGVTVAGA